MATLNFQDNINAKLELFDTNDYFEIDRIRNMIEDAFSEGIESPFGALEELMKNIQEKLAKDLGVTGSKDLGLDSILSSMFDNLNLSLELKNLMLSIADMVCNGISLPKFKLAKLEFLLLSLMYKTYNCEGVSIKSINLQDILIKNSNIPSLGETVKGLVSEINGMSANEQDYDTNKEIDLATSEWYESLSEEEKAIVDRINRYNSDSEILSSALQWMISNNSYLPTLLNENNSSTEGTKLSFDHSENHIRVGEGEHNNKFLEGYIPKYSIGLPFSMAYRGTNIKGINDLINKREEVALDKTALEEEFANSLTGEKRDKYLHIKELKKKLEVVNAGKNSLERKLNEALDEVGKNMVSVNRTMVGLLNTTLYLVAEDKKPESLDIILDILEDFVGSDASNNFEDARPNIHSVLTRYFDNGEENIEEDEIEEGSLYETTSVVGGGYNMELVKQTKERDIGKITRVEPVKKIMGVVNRETISKLLRYRDKLDITPKEKIFIDIHGSNYHDLIDDHVIPMDKVFDNSPLTDEEIIRIL